jgi:hypothetical protein
MLLNYKLSDETQTALRFSAPPTLRLFARSCITCIGPDVWRVPRESVPASLRCRISCAPARGKPAGKTRASAPADVDPNIVVRAKELLRQQGHPDGRLMLARDGGSYRWDTLGGLARPCLTAQIWRPAQPYHKRNGARVSVDNAGRVFLQFLHTQCRAMSIGQRCYVGMIPFSLLFHAVAPTLPSDQQSQRRASKRAGPHASEEHSPSPSRRPALSRCLTADSACRAYPGGPVAEVVGGSSPTRSQESDRSLSKLNLSREGSMFRVAAENQSEAPDAFSPWHVVAGPYGGRLGNEGSDPP